MHGVNAQLTDFIPRSTLQRLVDGFAGVTGYGARVSSESGGVLAESCSDSLGGMGGEDGASLAEHAMRRPPVVTIEVEGKRLGELSLCGGGVGCDDAGGRVRGGAGRGGRGGVAIEEAVPEGAREAEVVRFLYLLGDMISQVCSQGLALGSRVDELTTLFDLSTLLSDQRDLAGVLDTVVVTLVNVLGVKAAAIRLLKESTSELSIAAVHNLSERYLSKGKILLSESKLDEEALRGEVVEVADMAHDDRVMYPRDAEDEGLVSILAAGMVYRGKPIGVMRVYTGERHAFTANERNLLQAIAQHAAAAVRNAQLDARRKEADRIEQQVKLAADVQRRLLPRGNPQVEPFDVAGRYEPCFELGGDFYDFIGFKGALGLLVGDVVGKGVAASLLMASVRASFRAHVQDIYDIDEIMSLVNKALSRDTLDNEFATVFYGTLEAETRRLTYCSAGHEPGLLWRDGEFIDLDVGGMVLGVDPVQHYEKALVDLLPGDMILLYSDGLTDAANFDRQRFQRERIRAAVAEAAERGMTASGMVDHVLWEARRFVGLNRQVDDITIVGVRVK